MSARKDDVIELVEYLLLSNGGRYPRAKISHCLSEECRLGFGQDVDDIIGHMMQLGAVSMDTEYIVEFIPPEKRFIREREVLHDALKKSPTLSISISSAQEIIKNEVKNPDSRLNLNIALCHSEIREKLGVECYHKGEIIYLSSADKNGGQR